jgi:hypothetical protein
MKHVFSLQMLPSELVSLQDYWVEVNERTTQKNSNIRVTTGIRIRDSIFPYIVYCLISCLQLNIFINVTKFRFQSTKIAVINVCLIYLWLFNSVSSSGDTGWVMYIEVKGQGRKHL